MVQKIFYEVMTRTWIMLDIDKGAELRNYQDALIDNIFGHRSIDHFVKNQRTDTIVTTFDGKVTGYLAYDELEKAGKADLCSRTHCRSLWSSIRTMAD